MEDRQKFNEWSLKKQQLHYNKKIIYFRKKEIWWCALGMNIGYEQNGKNKNFERPVLVLRKINARLATIIPLSSKIKKHPYYYSYQQKGKKFSAIIFQLKTVSTKRFLRRIETMNKKDFIGILSTTINFIKEKQNDPAYTGSRSFPN